MSIVTGSVRRGDGITPAIALVDPKFPHNVGAAVRAASCYGVRQVWFSGDRVRLDGAKRQRLPAPLRPTRLRARGPRLARPRSRGPRGSRVGQLRRARQHGRRHRPNLAHLTRAGSSAIKLRPSYW